MSTKTVDPSDVEFCEYHSVDFATCLNIFMSNCPNYFATEELSDFEAFLLDLPGPYLTLKHRGQLVGCGGYAFNQADHSADLCWGMIHNDHHNLGLGDILLAERIQRIKMNPDITHIHLNTCQFTEGFFKKAGFNTEKLSKDGFAAGLDRYDMRLIL